MNRRPNKDKNKGPLVKEMLVNISSIEKRVAIMENGELVDFFMERKSLVHYAGSIYKGRVSAILQGIDAAFVDIGMEKNGFLHVSDVIDKDSVLKEMLSEDDEPEPRVKRHGGMPKIKDTLKVGQEIMVQVVKESIGTKGPRLTTFISLPGRYLVLTPYDKGLGISRRITDRNERKRIRDIIDKIGGLDEIGCIVRTVAEGRSEEELRSEFRYLMNLWKMIKDRAEKQRAPVTVYEEYGVVLRLLRDVFSTDISRLLVDSKEEYERIMKFLKSYMPSLRNNVKLYTARTPLFQKYNLDKQIDCIFERKVGLKSGGHLVIEQTEGVVVIDVNTGSFVGRKGLEQTAFKTNIEAAEEIPKQLLLRDIGGIIIIDFIDMEVKDHREKVFHTLQEKLKGDKARISVRGISQFGVVEMTRQRMRKSLESSSRVECPYCGGKGMIKSVETIAIEAVRRIDKILVESEKKHRHLKVTLNPDIHEALISDQAMMLSDIQRKYRCKIDLHEDKSLHVEDVIIDEK
jgi:Rne/Rng family ribonuclease